MNWCTITSATAARDVGLEKLGLMLILIFYTKAQCNLSDEEDLNQLQFHIKS